MNNNGQFNVSVRLKILGFAEDYQKIINKLVLIRANSDDDGILQTDTAAAVKVNLEILNC